MTTGEPANPVLEGEAAEAVAHRGGHVQIIAAAGSGKTEVVSQRVAALLDEREPAEAIVAFTFTEKAAEELKARIRQRATAKLGSSAADHLGRLFVGTIHGYCFRLLQTYVPRFETYTPLDSNQLTNLLYREQHRLDLKRLDVDGKLFRAIKAFRDSLDVLENELIPSRPFRTGTSRTWWSRTTRCSTATASCRSGRRSWRPSCARGRRGACRGDEGPPAPDRRRVPGREPGARTADRAACEAERHGGSGGCRRRRPGDLPVARVDVANIVTFRTDIRRHAVRAAREPPLAP